MNELNSIPMGEAQAQQAPRRRFLGQAMGAFGLAAGALVLPRAARAQDATTTAAAVPAPKAETVPQSDIDILTVALGLERLESAFYAQVLGAHNARAYLPARMLELARSISAEEASHTQTIEATLRALNASIPAVGAYKFPNNVFISPIAFAWFGYTLEEVGIGAYLGAVGKIVNGDIRRAAASIYGSETRHAALLRSNAGFTFSPRYYESPLTVAQVNSIIAPYLA